MVRASLSFSVVFVVVKVVGFPNPWCNFNFLRIVEPVDNTTANFMFTKLVFRIWDHLGEVKKSPREKNSQVSCEILIVAYELISLSSTDAALAEKT